MIEKLNLNLDLALRKVNNNTPKSPLNIMNIKIDDQQND